MTNLSSLSVGGVPVLGGGGQIPFTTGTYYFVSSTKGNAGNSGLVASSPLATIAGAISKATASVGDVIVLLPGHVETISTATALSLSKAGVTIVSLGYGSLRATITLDTIATATINVTAGNVQISNCVFVANYADIVSLFTLTTAAEFTLVDCEFRDTSSILNFLHIVDTDTTSNHADGLTMVRCKRTGAGATTATNIIKMDGTNDRLICEGCYFAHANVDDGGLFMVIATGKVVTNMQIDNCKFNLVGVSSATAGVLITTNGSTNSGYFRNCFVKHLDATSEIMVTASSGFVFWDLKATAVADKQGYLVPGADS